MKIIYLIPCYACKPETVTNVVINVGRLKQGFFNFLNYHIMAIITTPKGWAIEFENDYPHKDRESKARYLASEYVTTLNSLLQTMQTAQSNEDFTGEPDYYVFNLLSAMLPNDEDAESIFREQLYNDMAKEAPKQDIKQEPESMDKTTFERIRDLQNMVIELQKENEGLKAASRKN